MQISSINLSPKQAKILIKNLIHVGEIIDAEVVSKKSENTYIIKIKGELFEATSNTQLPTNKTKFVVKQLSPTIILKILDGEKPQEFIKTTLPPINLDLKEEDLIKNILHSIKDVKTENEPIKLISNIAKLNNLTNDIQIKAILSDIEQEFVKNKLIDKRKINEVILKLEQNINKTETHKDLEKLSHIIKEVIKQIKIENPNNLFMQIPLIKDQKTHHLYIKNEKNNTKQNKKSFKITVASNSQRFGFFQIDALEIEGRISIKLSFESKNSFEIFSNKLEDIKRILAKNVSLSIEMLDKRPIFRPKKLNIKI
ncbi:hypothetical protein [Hippea maritima]|uniref:Uncharacterized protein n=1 Tax=Hippea maritima (strain ATCC 700847 / DSM 10411 / MH2) TaxID=760142 RepID=F2LXC6_HIPMA|nr:hypothetical protein [Hippea maritima]AEA34240.1 hypothetical protein Hipma_1281 [Hippea maritima DSM 10411]